MSDMQAVKCECVGKHVPLPTQLVKYGGSNGVDMVWLCPTTHSNLGALLELYTKYDGVPPGSVRKHYSEYVQRLASDAWKARQGVPAQLHAGEYVVSKESLDKWWQRKV